MADAVIGALRVLLGVDTAAFSTGLGDASKHLDKFGKDVSSSLGKTAVAVSAAFTSTLGGLGVLIQHSINQMDDLGKMSQKIGVPVEKLSGLSVAAKLADVEIETLAKGMGRLSKEMVAAAAGGTSDAAAAFHYLGLSMKDLSASSPEQVFEKIADKLSQMENGTTKTALAIAVFGQRLGANLIPLLNSGARGLEEMRTTAEALGLVVSDVAAKQSEKFNDNLKLMGLAITGVGNVVAANFLPAMAKASDAMVKWVVDGGYVQKTAEVITRSIIFLRDNLTYFGVAMALVFGKTILTAIGTLGLAFINLGSAMVVAAASSLVLGAKLLITLSSILLVSAGVLALTGNLDKFLVEVEKFASNFSLEGVGASMTAAMKAAGINVDALTLSLKDLTGQSGLTKEELQKLLKPSPFDPNALANATKFGDEIRKIGLKAREVRGDFDQLAPGFVQAATNLKLIKDTGDGFSGTLDTLTPKQLALNNALLGLQAAQMIKDAQTPMEQYASTIQRIIQLQDMQAISAQVAAVQSAKAFEVMSSAYATAAATALGGFSQLFMAFGAHNKKMFEVGKAFAIAEATVNTYKAAAQALTAPPGPPFSYIYVAGAIAAGIAQVMKITQQKAPTFATGGSLTLGGAGGLDSKLVSMMMTPGEKVSVDQNKYGESSGSGKVVTVAGIKPKEFYTGDMLRDLIDNINSAVGDGYKIRMA